VPVHGLFAVAKLLSKLILIYFVMYDSYVNSDFFLCYEQAVAISRNFSAFPERNHWACCWSWTLGSFREAIWIFRYGSAVFKKCWFLAFYLNICFNIIFISDLIWMQIIVSVRELLVFHFVTLMVNWLTHAWSFFIWLFLNPCVMYFQQMLQVLCTCFFTFSKAEFSVLLHLMHSMISSKHFQ